MGKVLKINKKVLDVVVDVLKRGGVVICPTDTVYGFLVDASNKKAVAAIYNIKKRLKSKPLPLFVKNMAMAKELAEISPDQEKILKKYWPGKYTFRLKSKVKNQKSKLYGIDKKTIALRIPNHKFLNNLLKEINQPLVQTSVNISGEESLSNIKDIIRIFNKEEKIDIIIDGGSLKKSKSSTIIDLTSTKLLRLR